MKLVVATGDYAHTRTLARALAGDGLDIDWRPGRPETIFRQALADDAPFDVAEMSLATTWAMTARGETRFVPIPVFPSRMYRLSAFYVRDAIDDPAELRGGRIAVVRYGQTAAVWGRAFLAERFGIDLSEITWWVAERQSFEPQGVYLNDAGSLDTLQEMLADGRLDCLLATSVPEAFRQERVKRLFPDWAEAERALYRQTGVLPIMHTIIVRRRLAERFPELPGMLVRGFGAAGRAALDWLRDTDASSLPVPLQHGWLEVEARNGLLNAFPVGLEKNRGVLDDFAGHMHAQGLTSRRLAPEEVFQPVG